jgi:hypothetical protein
LVTVLALAATSAGRSVGTARSAALLTRSAAVNEDAWRVCGVGLMIWDTAV